MMSQIAVAYVIEACVFVSHALSRATAAGWHRRQLGDGNFTDECYQMALRSRLIITFPSIGDRHCEPTNISHKNSITGYTFLKPVNSSKTRNRLTGSCLTSLVFCWFSFSV